MGARKSPILSVDFSAIAHATEDIGRVEQAVRFVMESVATTKPNVTRQYLKGHHGNLITIISAKLSRKELPADMLGPLSGRLSDWDKQFLSDHISDCVDTRGNLYLRFDKQEAFSKRVKLHETDPVRMKLKFSAGYDVEAIRVFCRGNGLTL